jgi:hypothetical protein
MKTHDNHLATLAPLFALGCILILVIFVYRNYLTATTKTPTVILPGGVTYLGK